MSEQREEKKVKVRIATTCMVDRMIRTTGDIVEMDPAIAASFGVVISPAAAKKPAAKEEDGDK